MTHDQPSTDRLHDLVTESLGAGLDTADAAELGRLVAAGAGERLEEYELAAAACALAFEGQVADAMPDRLRQRCIGAAAALRSAPPQAARPMPRPRLRFAAESPSRASRGASVPWRSWAVAAAAVVTAAFAWLSPPSTGPIQQAQPVARSPAELRTELVASAADTIVWSWAQWGVGYDAVTGDVVWSESLQEGYLRLVNLPANDPNVAQYQLWIVESSRGTPLEVPPVDGGVFDATGTGELIIPIRARLRSTGVVAFGLTLEPPSGVVVSDRQRRVVIAAPNPPG
jgi:hypothetical protein